MVTSSSPLDNLHDTIKGYLPDATEDQIKRFAHQFQRLQELEKYFSQYPEDLERWKDKSGFPINEFARAIKALDYQRPYRIAMIGLTGAGKSTLLNALLGRSLVLMKDIGKPATGAALEIFLDVSQRGIEKADVSYRKESNIRELIKDFVERYQLDASGLTGNLDAGFATALRQLQPQNSLTERERREFEELRNTLADIVIQSANNGNHSLRTEFFLSNSTDVQELMNLIDENSQLNSENNPQRRIGLVKSVTYHIKPHSNLNGLATLHLPGNVCLVDLPGLDGTPLHDIIISEGIKDADAVVFILRPPRILGRGDAYLLNRVRKYISLEGSSESGDRIFLVLNARDSIMVDDRRTPDNLPRDMQDLMDLLVPNYARYFSDRGGEYPYFLTSAWAAYAAQKQLNGEPIKDIQTYESVKLKLGVQGRGDREVLEASQVPKLAEELTKFAREHRIEGQIRDGKSAVDSIIEWLIDSFKKDSQIRDRRGTSYLTEKREEIIKKRQKEQERLVKQIRESQESRLENLRSQLAKIAQSICDRCDRAIQEKMPELWKTSFLDVEDRLGRQNIAKLGYECILTETQINLWYELTHEVPDMAKKLVRAYTDQIATSQIAEKIARGCYNYVDVSLLHSTIQEKIDENMHRNLPEIARRIAITQMTDPALYFTAMDANGHPEKKQLFDRLAQIPRQPEVSSQNFTAFITEIRKIYEKFVSPYCIVGLLNVYRYEMIVIEDSLLDYIKQMFHKIRYSNDPILNAAINESLSDDPNWKRLELIQQKLAILETIKS
ncbi:dynamin family protein [Roseofilum sp. BLCC_M91]|uniref:Dynamin family protein n=1 Tax=Roseofilum halophilum BLCC-M91 TaxID=3022259 RepID=A0ABT7BML3_9CYAN|nr:dynamin family protein [Roseofilum halophilum]MDJ1180444.1 dynamin family protein [Roseofilum halophilum BLCC-M91]